jgi:hypothetical protein
MPAIDRDAFNDVMTRELNREKDGSGNIKSLATLKTEALVSFQTLLVLRDTIIHRYRNRK